MTSLHRINKHLFCAVAFSVFATGVASQAAQMAVAPSAITAPDNTTTDITPIRAAKFRDGSYAGAAFDAYYGLVQVQANIQSGQLVSIDVLNNPKHSGTSRSINRKALPVLETAVIRAQSTRVNLVSGATLTSRAYLRSLNSALKQAGG